MTEQKFTTTPAMIRRMSPDIRAELMRRSEAARAYIDRAMNNPERQREAELHAFMSIFHPEVPLDRVREMARDLGA
jgi:hypothetical protein